MTENEALKELNACVGNCVYIGCEAEAMHEAIKALNEIQQYRAIGTVEQLSNALENVKTLSRMYEELNDQEVYEYHKLLEYEKIGTIEECREARERQKSGGIGK